MLLSRRYWTGCLCSLLLLCNVIGFAECHDDRPMRMTWLDMNLNCEGVCYYFTDDDSPIAFGSDKPVTPSTIPYNDPNRCANYPYGSAGFNATAKSTKSCRAIFSITEYIPINCQGFDRQPLSDSLCQRNLHLDRRDKTPPKPSKLYKITLAYRMKAKQTLGSDPPRLTAYSCDPSRYFHKVYTVGTACYPTEYIGVTFSTKPDLRDDYNPWYVCIMGEPRVQGWRDHHKKAWRRGRTRISLGFPYVNAAPGVYWSTILKPKGEDTLICSFILDAKERTYKQTFWDGRKFHVNLATVSDTFGLEKFGGRDDRALGEGWSVKMSFGHIKRERIPDGGMYSHITYVPTHERENMVISDIYLLEKTIAEKTRRPSLVGKLPVLADPAKLAKISKVYKACFDKKALCYHFDDEDACIQREKCHALMAIREVPKSGFKRLRINLVSHHKEIPGVIIPVSPIGWVAAAFSHDRSMGMEVAFSCAFMGYGNYKLFMTMNGIDKINVPVFDSMISPSPFFKNVEIVASVTGIETEPRVMCTFDIPTEFSVEFRPHYLLWSTVEQPRLTYDLKKKKYFVLLATGGTVTSTFNLTFHGKDRGQVMEKEFSREYYYKYTGKAVTFRVHSAVFIYAIVALISMR